MGVLSKRILTMTVLVVIVISVLHFLFVYFFYQTSRSRNFKHVQSELISAMNENRDVFLANTLLKQFDAIDMLKVELKKQYSLNDVEWRCDISKDSKPSVGEPKIFMYAGDSQLLSVSNTYEVSPNRFCELFFSKSSKSIISSTGYRWHFYSLIAFAGTLILIIGAALLITMRHSFSKPLGAIFRVIDKLANGEYDIEPVNAKNEFDRVLNKLQNLGIVMKEDKRKIETQSRLAAIGETTAMIAHDIRKPYSQIKGLLDLLSNKKDDVDFIELSKMSVESSLKRADSMIDSILDYTRETKIKQERYNPQAFIASAIGEVFQTRNAKDISIDYDLRHKNYLYVDRDKMFRAFTNIIDNALDAMSGVGKMWISTCDIDCFVRIVIGNNGPVIPKGLLPKIFDPFFTICKKGGTGLGLAICHKIVSAHGGKICVESEEGRTEFILDIPAQKGDFIINESELIRHSSEVKQAGIGCTKGPLTTFNECIGKIKASFEENKRKHKVLVIDDEGLFRESVVGLVRTTEQIKDFLEIDEASNVKEAFEKGSKADFVICDIDMGDKKKDGYDVAEGLLSRYMNIKLVIHSNKRRNEDDKRLTVFDGMKGFIAKPMTKENLLMFLSGMNFKT